MGTRLILAVSIMGALTSACAYPVSTVEQGSASSGVYFKGAGPNDEVLIDGAAAGLAASFDGKKVILTVRPGTHHVTVRNSAGSIYDKDVYVGAGARLPIKVR